MLHFAGKIEVAESVARPDLYWDVNVVGTIAVLTAMRAAGTQRLIFSSTGSMYDPAGMAAGGKLAENAAVRPNNPYAATKLAVDLMLAGECAAFGLGAASLRYFNASGAVGPLGERHSPESHLIPIVLDVAAGRRDELMLYGDDYPTPDGTCIRDYIHVADLATAHLLALDAIKPGRHEIYNLGNGDGYSNKQVIEAVREVTGRPVPVKLSPRRPGDPAASVAASDKARRELGWRPARPRPARHHRRRLVLPPVRLVTARRARSCGVSAMLTRCSPAPLSGSDLPTVKSASASALFSLLATGGPT